MKVTVIDYGLSNLLSVRHAFAHFGAETLLTSDPADVLAAEKLVLPGVGAFKDGTAPPSGEAVHITFLTDKLFPL